MRFTLAFFVLFLFASIAASAEILNITTQQLAFSTQINSTFISPINTTLTYVCSSFVTSCPSQEVASGVTNKAIPFTVPGGTTVGTYEQFILVTGTNITYQHNVTVIVNAYTGVIENNFSINVTLSDTLSDYYLVQLYGPDGTQVSFTVSEIGKQGISGSKTIGENGVHGMYQFFHQPFNNGQYKSVADFTYNGNTFHKEFTFTVSIFSDLTYQLNVSSGPYTPGQTIMFQTILSSFEDPVTFKWDLNNDGVIDATTANTSYIYSTKGAYIVNLTVQDKIVTKSKLVTLQVVDPPVLFRVRTEPQLEGAEISVGSSILSTNTSGEAVFNLTPGSYSLRAKKSGYGNYSAQINLTTETTYTFSMQELLLVPVPTSLKVDEIVILTPNNDTFEYVTPLTIKFELKNAFVQQCTLKVDGTTLATFSTVAPNTQYSYDWTQVKAGSHEVIVDCLDAFNSTQIKKFAFIITSQNSGLILKEKAKSEQVYSIFNDAIIGLRSMSSENAKRIISSLNLEEDAYKNRDELSSIIAQYDAIDFTLEHSYLEKELTTLGAKVSLLQSDTVVNFTILDSSQFVYLPSAKDITDVAHRFAQYNMPEDFSIEKYVKEALRQKTSVTTHVHLVELQKGNGEKEYVTFVQRVIQRQGNGTYVELLPKQFVDGPESIVLLDQGVDILEFSPSLMLGAAESTTLSYYVKKQLFTSDLERFPAAILPDVKTNTSALILPWFITGVVISLLIGSLYHFHRRNLLPSPKKFYTLAKKRVSAIKKTSPSLSVEQIGVISQAIDQIYSLAISGQEEKSALLYSQMESLYEKVVDPSQKAMINDKLHTLGHQLIILHMRNSMKKALHSASNNVFHEAQGTYEEVLGFYMSLPQHHQAQVQHEVLTLKERITSLYRQESSKPI